MSQVRSFIGAAALAGCVAGFAGVAQAQAPPAPAEAPPSAPAAAEPAPPAAEPAPAPAAEAAPAPAAKPRAPSSLEIWAGLGPSVLFGEPANPEYADSFSRAGGYGELGIAYRSKYFVDPFLSLGYASLARGDAHLPEGAWGPAGHLEQSLTGWFISPGITADLWRFRLRFGIGISVLHQSFSYNGEDSSSDQFPLMNELGVGFNAIDHGRFRLDAEARVITAPGADLTFMTLSIIARGDLVVFGGTPSPKSEQRQGLLQVNDR